MYYEINVSLNGRHFFATDSRSIKDKISLVKVYKVLKEKFPESEGYLLTVTYNPECEYGCEVYEDGTVYDGYYDKRD